MLIVLACTAATAPDAGSLGFVALSGGTVTLGSPESEVGRYPNEVQRTVTVAPYELMATELTQAHWLQWRDDEPWAGPDCPDCPVEQASWYAALEFANAVSVAEGLPACFTCSGDPAVCGLDLAWPSLEQCPGYRLPSEAEWEAAAREGSSGVVAGAQGQVLDTTSCEDHGGDLLSDGTLVGDYAWYRCTATGPEPVAQLLAAGPGLYDLSGNVVEWTFDAWQETPDARVDESLRVSKGGGYGGSAHHVRVALRDGVEPWQRYPAFGFRLARSVTSGPSTAP